MKFTVTKDEIWNHYSDMDVIADCMRVCSWPIWCHSEIDSPGVKTAEEYGMIPCYYFWHALISRDWFRHWKHHPDLLAGNTDWSNRFLLYARDWTGTRSYRKAFLDRLEPLRDTVLYDWQQNHQINSDHSAKIVPQDAVSSAIHIVAETIFDLDSRIHLTEKVFKPMVMKQPFILLGPKGSLNYLRGYGFKTFDSIWDESYDDEQDAEIRMQKILDLIGNLAALPHDRFQEKINAAIDIVVFNHQHFFSERFENILLKEWQDNFERSLDIQKEKAQQDPGGMFLRLMDRYQSLDSVRIHGKHTQAVKDFVVTIKQQQPDRYRDIMNRYKWLTDL